MSLTFRARTCDHMIYDGACDCNERGSGDFLAELSAILAEEPIQILREENEADAHLADVAAEDLAEHNRLIDYLEGVVREEATIENVAEEVRDEDRDDVGDRDDVEVMDEDYFQNCDCDYGHYSPSYDQGPDYYEQEQEPYFDIADEF